jgi:ribosomal protein S18 acetylase RimI-like enzyme
MFWKRFKRLVRMGISMDAAGLHLTAYARRHHRTVMTLINHIGTYLHNHLDWIDLADWLDMPNVPIQLAWQEDQLVGVMAFSPPIDGASWLRLAAVDEESDVAQVLQMLWLALQQHPSLQLVHTYGALLSQRWLSPYLSGFGFAFKEHIVTMRREGDYTPQGVKTAVHIRRTDDREVGEAHAIDRVAFGPLWQMGLPGMRRAIRDSASFTVAEQDGQAIGYQISSGHWSTAHLARLAVLPELQGQGIGAMLLDELIADFARRGITIITVNTQESNIRSQALYQRFGFTHTSNDTPFWQMLK